MGLCCSTDINDSSHIKYRDGCYIDKYSNCCTTNNVRYRCCNNPNCLKDGIYVPGPIITNAYSYPIYQEYTDVNINNSNIQPSAPALDTI